MVGGIHQILSLLLIGVVTTSSQSTDCSDYNPCGPHGYCIDDTNGNWQCQCKFWWNGTLCNQQTSSGIQVITLGSIVGVLLILFYGLGIFCSIRKKRKQPKEDSTKKKRSASINPNFQEIALISLKQSARLSSFVVFLLVLIVAGLSLLTKWFLLQSVHDDLVRKYHSNEDLFYQRSSFCDLIDARDVNLLTMPLACFLTFLLTCWAKRTSFHREKCKGFIGPVIPLDFYIHVKRTFAAVIFAIIAEELLDIINQVLNGKTSANDGVIVLYLLRVFTVLVIGIRYYPVLSAVYLDTIFALACATVYACFDFSLSIIYQSWCQSEFYPTNNNFDETNGTDLARLFQFYGTGQNLVIIQLFTDIPRFLCWSYVVVKLPLLLIKKISSTIENEKVNRTNSLVLTREEKLFLHSSAPHSVEMSYVRNLFRSVDQRSTSRFLISRLMPKFVYQWRDDFRYSSRIVCLYASVFLLLFFITAQTCILVPPVLEELRQSFQQFFDLFTSANELASGQAGIRVPHLAPAFLLAIGTALIITLIQLLVLLANIRRNLFQLYRADYSEIPKRDRSRYVNYGTGNFNFAGFFIGYLTWGFFLIVVFAFFIFVAIDSFITFGSVRFVEQILKQIIPVILLTLLKVFLNKILARYVFLQDYGETLAINNRRYLMIFLYFNFFLDSFLGFVSSIVRIVKSIIGGCFYMCRLDYSPLGRKLENLDAGFAAYCGFIHFEAIHRNPTMLALASYLYGRMKAKQYTKTNNAGVSSANRKKRDKMDSSRMTQKWHLAVLLIRNPSLRSFRKKRVKSIEEMTMDEDEMKPRRLSCVIDMTHRPSLITENDLEKFWTEKL